MGPGLVYDDSTWTGGNPQGIGIGGSISFGPGGVSGGITGGVGTAAPCGPGTSCGAQQNNFALILIAIAVVVLVLR
jgi:hypothetical protein